jgi:hypothetical protein
VIDSIFNSCLTRRELVYFARILNKCSQIKSEGGGGWWKPDERIYFFSIEAVALALLHFKPRETVDGSTTTASSTTTTTTATKTEEKAEEPKQESEEKKEGETEEKKEGEKEEKKEGEQVAANGEKPAEDAFALPSNPEEEELKAICTLHDFYSCVPSYPIKFFDKGMLLTASILLLLLYENYFICHCSD